jgi:hypothetical protein
MDAVDVAMFWVMFVSESIGGDVGPEVGPPGVVVVVVVDGFVGGVGAVVVVMTRFEMFVEQITRDPPPFAEPLH